MPSGPPKLLENLARLVIPPACREEVLGDLHERYRSPAQYLGDLIATVPFLIVSRIVRTTDLQLLLTDTLLIYGSFLAATWFLDKEQLSDARGLLHIALPALLTLVYQLLSDALFSPRGSIWMAGLVTSGLFFTGLAAPRNIYGFLCGLFLDSGMRALVRFGMNRPQSAAGTGLGLNQKSERIEISRSSRLVLNAAVTFLCTGAAAGIIVLAPRATLLVVVLCTWAVGYHFLKPR